MVSGFGAPLDRNLRPLLERLTYPEDWWPKLRQDYNYRVAMSGVDLEDKSQVVAEIADLIRLRFKLLLDLLHSGRYDFLHLTIFYINTLQHFYGADEAVAQAWELIDRFIGELLETGSYLFVFSDHGTMKIEHSFWINNWLISGGYLKLKSDAGDIIGWLDSWGQRRLNWRKRHLSALAQTLLPVRWQDKLPGMHQLLRGNMIDQKVNWPASAAVSLSQGVIYINRRQVGAGYEKVRDELSHGLESLRLPGSTRRVIERVYRREELYTGDYLAQAPDLVALPARGVEIYGGIGGEVFESRKRPWSSGNHPEGILIVHGKGIAHKKLEHASLLDIAPTIMHLLGAPLPEDMDGRVLGQIFQPQSCWTGKGIKYQPPWKRPVEPDGRADNSQSLREELTSLGYLD
jgi:predicted AlkP superfamily phosphohydrolase/phosphomutase